MTRCHVLLFALCSLAAACGITPEAASSAPASPTVTPQHADTATLQEQCVATMTRSRACTEQYVAALVDARARLDRPDGIAAAVSTDRDAVIAQARSEWMRDSTSEAIAERCRAMVAHLPPEAQADASDAGRCVAQTDCGAFVACVMPIVEKHLAN